MRRAWNLGVTRRLDRLEVFERLPALHAVEPTSDSRTVSRAPHRGQLGAGGTKRSACVGSFAAGPGGAMPCARSLVCASGVSQSLLHAGDRRVSTETPVAPAP